VWNDIIIIINDINVIILLMILMWKWQWPMIIINIIISNDDVILMIQCVIVILM